MCITIQGGLIEFTLENFFSNMNITMMTTYQREVTCLKNWSHIILSQTFMNHIINIFPKEKTFIPEVPLHIMDKALLLIMITAIKEYILISWQFVFNTFNLKVTSGFYWFEVYLMLNCSSMQEINEFEVELTIQFKLNAKWK